MKIVSHITRTYPAGKFIPKFDDWRKRVSKLIRGGMNCWIGVSLRPNQVKKRQHKRRSRQYLKAQARQELNDVVLDNDEDFYHLYSY
jgi:hypothetical protein